jgi:hypothetical protein
MVTFEQAGTEMTDVLKAMFFATSPMVAAPGGVVVAVAVAVAVVTGTVVAGAVVAGTVVGGEVMVMVGVGVTGGAGVVHPAARSRETARRPRRRYVRSCLMTAPVSLLALNVSGQAISLNPFLSIPSGTKEKTRRLRYEYVKGVHGFSL